MSLKIKTKLRYGIGLLFAMIVLLGVKPSLKPIVK